MRNFAIPSRKGYKSRRVPPPCGPNNVRRQVFSPPKSESPGFTAILQPKVNFTLTISNTLYKVMPMDGLDTKFSALADPTRRAILARLSQGEATVNELASPFEMTQPAISQHLKVLEDAGL